jgi:integrase
LAAYTPPKTQHVAEMLGTLKTCSWPRGWDNLHQRYLGEHAKKHNKSWRQAEALVNRHVLPRWGNLQASTITRSDVKQMTARIEAPVVANQTLAAASAIFTWAVKEETLPANPCKLVGRNPVRSRERVLADSEVPRFWAAFADAGLIAGTALKMILLTGQRPGEIAHMRHEHIKDGWWEMAWPISRAFLSAWLREH